MKGSGRMQKAIQPNVIVNQCLLEQGNSLTEQYKHQSKNQEMTNKKS